MTFFKLLPAVLLIGAATAIPAAANTGPKPGNCAIIADMSAKTVKKDKRFDDRKAIASALGRFAKAQTAKMDAGMAETYAASAAFGWDKAKVDKMMKDNDKAMRAGFVGPTMEKDKLYMDHLQALYACAEGAQTQADAGQSPQALKTMLQAMAKTLINGG